jgi:hypothetical protein
MKKLLNVVTLVGLALVLASPALAQRPEKPFQAEARAGYMLPTGDIADFVDGTFGFGASFGYYFTPKFVIMAEFDYGSHSYKTDIVDPGFDLGSAKEDVMHLMGKIGYVLFQSADGKMKILVNAGAGAMNFKFKADGIESESTTKFAINAGAKFYYMFTPSIGIVISPQGDIAFTNKDEDGSSSKWVWPLTAGFAFNF